MKSKTATIPDSCLPQQFEVTDLTISGLIQSVALNRIIHSHLSMTKKQDHPYSDLPSKDHYGGTNHKVEKKYWLKNLRIKRFISETFFVA